MGYKCTKCDATSSKWTGRCLNCKEWGTVKEFAEEKHKNSEAGGLGSGKIAEGELLTVKTLSDLNRPSRQKRRITTNIPDIDELLGGGLVEGQTMLLSGEPGVGKSTLALQLADSTKIDTLYVSGEETIEQIAERARRITSNNPKLSLSYGTDVLSIISSAKTNKSKLVIIDSAQTLTYKQAKAGSASFLRESVGVIVKFAKQSNTIILLVGQVTKSGEIAGPKTLEHLVDTVVYVEGERSGDLRIARVLKNRYGKTDSTAVFRMEETGLKEVKDPSTVFIEETSGNQTGVAKTVTLEGQIPLAIEIQALIANTPFALPKRVANGLLYNKLSILLGALNRYTSLGLGSYDVFVNIAGGISTKDPASDLAVCAATYSSAKNTPIPSGTFFIGEVELSGRVRAPKQLSRRIEIAKRCGARELVTGRLPAKDHPKLPISMKLIELETLKELANLLRAGRSYSTAQINTISEHYKNKNRT